MFVHVRSSEFSDFIAEFGPESRNIVMFLSVVRSAEFSDFIAKCLVKDPDQRSSACDLREVIIVTYG